MLKGFILKGVAGKYIVRTKKGDFTCEITGKIKYDTNRPMVGDFVLVEIINKDESWGMINEILPRKTELHRPRVSNVSQAVIVFALKHPDPHLNLLDRIITFSEYTGLKTVICFNKADIVSEDFIKSYKEIYEKIGYQVIITSVKEEKGKEELIEVLKDEITVFAGPSGVGKSSLLNMIQPNLKLRTGEISKKIKRGKHTTRHTELISLNEGGWVVDTPGFANLDVSFIDEYRLGEYFKEIDDCRHKCKFNNCMHLNEPKCAVKDKLKRNEMAKSRYDSYTLILNEIRENRRF
ncbi:MAG TPA: ribosome small subunit-dependent GTPase A [Clostridia bacterium]|nr:ribosome small subunit-dependent GTPase A [Clostridia bacterium]